MFNSSLDNFDDDYAEEYWSPTSEETKAEEFYDLLPRKYTFSIKTAMRAYAQTSMSKSEGEKAIRRGAYKWLEILVKTKYLTKYGSGKSARWGQYHKPLIKKRLTKAEIALKAKLKEAQAKKKQEFKQMAIDYNEGSIKELLKDEPDEIVTQVCEHYDIKPTSITTSPSGSEGASTSVVTQYLGLTEEEKRCMFGNPPRLAPIIELTEMRGTTGTDRKMSFWETIRKGIREMLVLWGK